MNLRDAYRHAVAQGQIAADPDQQLAIAHLEVLHARVQARVNEGWLGRLRRRMAAPRDHPRQGIYLWGGVGRGKTWLMDCFFESLPIEAKLRLHYRHFMQQIHEQLARLRGQRDPLRLVAREYAQHTRVLCVDEFYVEDITDAMILHRLLDELLRRGVCIVLTSNLAPDDLYRNGLQRERFLPAIALLKSRLEIIHLQGDTDHRLRKLRSTYVYFTPLNSATELAIEERFTDLAPGHIRHGVELDINHRQLHCRRCADDVVWFEFPQLCAGPRSSADYIELARQFHTVCLSRVPILTETHEEWAHRFVNLIDEFYDRRVKLIISADTEPQYLYQGRKLRFEFQRTVSRLLEMRSDAYLASAHRP